MTDPTTRPCEATCLSPAEFTITLRVKGIDSDAAAFAEWLDRGLEAYHHSVMGVTILDVSDPERVPASCGRDEADCEAEGAQQDAEFKDHDDREV